MNTSASDKKDNSTFTFYQSSIDQLKIGICGFAVSFASIKRNSATQSIIFATLFAVPFALLIKFLSQVPEGR